MNNKRVLAINLMASVMTLVVNVAINLLVMPYIVNMVSAEAYGFVSLANNIVNYATIITVALNSVSSRFIALHIHQGRIKEANEYFNSVFWADLILGVIIIVIGSIFTIFVDQILNVPEELVVQVRLLFIWLLINLLLSVIGTIFTVATYITNKLYLSSIANTVAIWLKAATLWILFGILPANISFIGIGSVVNSLIVMLLNAYYTKALTPELKISLKSFSPSKTKEMLSSGIWSSITKLSATLSDGLDTLITNLFLNGAILGALSVAYTLPTLASQLVSAVCALFNPNLTYCYAKNDMEAIVRELKRNMKLTGTFASVLFCGIVVFGREVFFLLVPKENITLIYQLACLSCISMVVSGVTAGLTNAFILTNKLKVNSIVWLAVSIFDILLVIILLKTTSLGVFAIAGVSKIVGAIINLTYLPIYVSHCLKIRKTTFYPLMLRYFIVLLICLVIFKMLCRLMAGNYSWPHFIINIIVCGSGGILINSIFLLDKGERRSLLETITRKNRRK